MVSHYWGLWRYSKYRMIRRWSVAILLLLFGSLICYCFLESRVECIQGKCHAAPLFRLDSIFNPTELPFTPRTNRTFVYKPFRINPPNFGTEKDKELFFINRNNLKDLQPQSKDRLIGRIITYPKGVVSENYDCGWKALTADIPDDLKHPKKIRHHFHIMCPLLVPQSNSYQHFLDGVLPKIIQAESWLHHAEVTLLIYQPWDEIIFEILQSLGFTKDRLHFAGRGIYGADFVINTCITPPIHPDLWNRAREILRNDSQGSMKSLFEKNSQPIVVLISRLKARYPGRRIKNWNQVSNALQKRYGHKLVLFQERLSLTKTRQIFSRAGIVIGVHGEGLYNILFASENIHVLEIVPTLKNGMLVPDNLPHNIIWKMASMLNQTYWRLSEIPLNDQGDIYVNITKVERILDTIGGGSNKNKLTG